MGFNLRQKLEETFADVNPFDNGATAQTVRAKRTKAAPAQTLKVQNRPQFQQNNQPVYQQQQQKQFKIQSPSLNINNSMPKVQTFGQSNDPLKVGQVKTPQIQTPQKAPMMLTPDARQEYARKQQMQTAAQRPQPQKPAFSMTPVANAQSTPTKSTTSQVSGISNETWSKMTPQAQTNLRVQEHNAKRTKGNVFNPLTVAGDVVKASLGVAPAAAKMGTDMIVDLGNRTADFGEAGATVIGELNGANKRNEAILQKNIADQERMTDSFVQRARNARTQEEFDKYLNMARKTNTGASDITDTLNRMRGEGMQRTDPAKTISNAGMTALDLATLGKGKMILEGAKLGTKVTAPVLSQLAKNTAITGLQGSGIGGAYGGLSTMKDPDATAEDYAKNIGMGMLVGGGLGVGAQVALPVAGVAAKQAAKGAESAAIRSVNYGLKPPTNLSKVELQIAAKVRQAQEGYISPQDLTTQEASIYQNIQRKLGAKPGTPEGEMAVVDALGAHRDFETRRGVRKEKTLDGLEKSSRFAQDHLIPAGSMRGVGDDGLPLPYPSRKPVTSSKFAGGNVPDKQTRAFAMLDADMEAAGYSDHHGIWVDNAMDADLVNRLTPENVATLKAQGITHIEKAPTKTGIEYGNTRVGDKNYGVIKVSNESQFKHTTSLDFQFYHESGHHVWSQKMTPEDKAAFSRLNPEKTSTHKAHEHAGRVGGEMDSESFSDYLAMELQGKGDQIPTEVRPIVQKYAAKPDVRSTFYDSLDVPKKDLIIKNGEGTAMSIEPSKFEADLQKAGLGAKPDTYRTQPKDIKKAIDAHIAKERPDLAYTLDESVNFPDGLPKIRPEDVMRIAGVSARELGIPPNRISKSAQAIDELAMEFERNRGMGGVQKLSDDDYLSMFMDELDSNRNKVQNTKTIREMRNDPKVLEKARQTLEQEKAQYGAPEVFEPSKSDVRAYQKMVTPETASIAPQLARSRRQTPELSTNPQNGLPQAKQLSSSQQKLGSAEPTPDSPVNESITSLDSTTKPQVNQVKVKQVGRDKNVPVMKQTRDGDVITATNVNDKIKVGEKRYSVDEDGKLIEDKKGATSLFTDKDGRVTGFRVGKEYFNAKDLGDLTSVNGYGSTLATMRRNVERAFDKKTGDKVSAFLVDHQQGQATKLIQRQVEMKQGMQTLADDLGINFGFGSKRAKKVSAAIQDFGEGKRDRASLVSEYGNKMADKIIGADKWFRKNYDTLLDEMNSTLKQFGYDPVPKRKNYYTHFQDEGLWQKFGLKMQEIRDLSSPTMQDANPTGGRGSISNKLAGMSENTAPNKAFNKFALQRKGNKHTSDAFKAFELYLNPTLNNIYMTPSISRARVLSRAIAQDADVVGKDANKIIVQTREWANSLAGKSSRIGDRQLADTMAGPHILKALAWAQKKTGQNTIVGNLSTAVMQPIVLGQTAGKFGYKNTMAGLYQQATGALSSAQAQSGFLKRRYTDVSPVTATKLDRGAKVANKPLEIVEENAVRSTWNAAHNDAVSKGMTGRKAIRYADVETEKTVAGRSIGERPEVFRSKSAGLATMFQLEVNNFWQQTGKEMSKTQVAKTMVAMYGLNLLLQEVTGRQVGFNPIDAAIDSYDEATKERPGEGAAVLERSKRIGQRWTGEFVDNAPFIGMAANNVFGEKAVKEWTGNDSNIGRFGASSPIRTLADNPWMAVSPFGGGQIKKTVEAVPVLLDGKLKDKEGKTLVDVPQTPRNIATGLAFGNGAIPEVSQYYSNIGKKKVDQKAVKNQSVSSAGSMSLDGLTKEQQTMLSTAREDMKPTLIEQYRKDNKAGYTAEKSGTKAPAKSTAKPLPADMSSTAKSILESYNSMSTEDKKKWDKTTATGTTARSAMNKWLGGKAEVPKISNEIARDWANYEKGIKDGSINVLEKDTKKKEILRKAYNEQLSDVEKTMYKLSKADIQRYAETGDITEANLNKALTVEKQLFDAGLISKETLASKLGVAARGYKGKTAKKSGGKKGGRKVAKGKFDYKLNGFGTTSNTSNSKQLHDLLKKARMRVSA